VSVTVFLQRALAPAALTWLALNLYLIHTSGLPLSTDELQYWLWSETLAWGYYSKPPGIAFAMAQWRLFDPQAEYLRALPQLLLALACATVYPLAREAGLAAGRAALAALLMACIPFVAFAQWFATTDALLLLFWNLSLLAAWLALHRAHPVYWVFLGLVGALGMLSKHFMPFFLVGLLGFIAWEKKLDRTVGKGLALATLVAGVVLAPHLVWLFSHPDTTLAHLADLQGARGKSDAVLGAAWKRGLEFALAQCIGIGPLLIPLGILASRRAFQQRPAEPRNPEVETSPDLPPAISGRIASPFDRWLLAQSLPVLALFVIQASWKQAYANWAFPAAFTLGLWLVLVLLRNAAWSSLAAGLMTNLLLAGFINHGASLALRTDSAAWVDRIDPLHRQRGWDRWIDELKALSKPKHIAWAVRDRDSAARIRHAFPEDPLVYLSTPDAPKHHYALQYAPRSPAQKGDRLKLCIWIVERAATSVPDAGPPPPTLIAQVTRSSLGGTREYWSVREESCASR